MKVNSLWGKWTQNKTQRTLVTLVKVLYEFLTSPGTEVAMLVFPNDDVVWVYFKYCQDNIAAWENVNVVVAAYLTTHTGLKLYEYLSECGNLSCIVIHSECS